MTSAARVPALMISSHVAAAGVVRLQAPEQELAEADHPGHHVVDLVRHAAGELPGGLHPLGPAELLLHPLPLGDVAVDAPDHDRAAVLEGAAEVALDRDRRAGLGHEDQLDVVQASRRQHPLEDLGVVRPALGVHHVEQLHAADLLFAVPGALLPGVVHVQERAVRRRHAHQIAGVVEQIAIALLALPERPVGPLPLAHVPGVQADPR